MKDSQPSQVHIGAKIPAELNDRLNRMAEYVRGGKSEIVRRALAIGLPSVQEAYFAAVYSNALTKQHQ
jgi:predicted DNA-binding protein